ncbi:CHAP domain-containing protein [Nonomuraea cypriaca]|nr:CHAP domain-containing protein [Nonomuraea cypriaca]
MVFFDWSGSKNIPAIDRVGVVESVHKDGTVVTIEGNTAKPGQAT